jgi:hypothetical protein
MEPTGSTEASLTQSKAFHGSAELNGQVYAIAGYHGGAVDTV